MRAVLQLAAEKAGWDKPLPAGHYRGIACFGCFQTYMAEVVEITMENDQPKVHRVVAAVDCGQVVNPAILEQQIQGGVVYGLANALRAKITIERAASCKATSTTTPRCAWTRPRQWRSMRFQARNLPRESVNPRCLL